MQIYPISLPICNQGQAVKTKKASDDVEFGAKAARPGGKDGEFAEFANPLDESTDEETGS